MNSSRSSGSDLSLPESAWALRCLQRILRLRTKLEKQDASEIYGVIGLATLTSLSALVGSFVICLSGFGLFDDRLPIVTVFCLAVPELIFLSSTVVAVMLCRDSFLERILALAFLFFVFAVGTSLLLFGMWTLLPYDNPSLFRVGLATTAAVMPSAIGTSVVTVVYLFLGKHRPMPIHFSSAPTKVSGIALIMQFTFLLAVLFGAAMNFQLTAVLLLTGYILAGSVAGMFAIYFCKRQLNEGTFMMIPGVKEIAVDVTLASLVGLLMLQATSINVSVSLGAWMFFGAMISLLCWRLVVGWLRACGWSYRS